MSSPPPRRPFRLKVTETEAGIFRWEFLPGNDEACYREALANIDRLRAEVAAAIDAKAWTLVLHHDRPPNWGRQSTETPPASGTLTPQSPGGDP